MKKGMIIIVAFLFLSVGAFAELSSNSSLVDSYVKEFVGRQGIDESKIVDVVEIDKNELPDGVDIKNIEDNKVGIYGVDYADDSGEKRVFVVTYSTTQFVPRSVARTLQNYYFGFAGVSSSPGYLETVGGVNSGRSGYIMLRSGSLTGLSTSIELEGDGFIEIKVYKNGRETGLDNRIFTSDSRKTDYVLQSENILNFEAGDEISVFVKAYGDITWTNVNTILETTLW